MARTITQIPVSKLPEYKPKRVCGYGRVSSAKDAMHHSLAAQVSYFSTLIQKTPGWVYAGVYSDEAFTGTKNERPQFQQMLSDCRAGQIDMIITKSISRFARNTVTLLQTARELKELGIDIYFEEQKIHTISSDGELLLTLLAAHAQAESESVSSNCKWRIRSDFKNGIPTSTLIYGYRIKGRKYTIVPEKAEVVRQIFDLYLGGLGGAKIAGILTEDGIPSYHGSIWSPSVIKKMLKNEKYCGDLLLQKVYRTDHLTKKTVKNNGTLPKYYVEDNHEGIIGRETFRAVQAEMEKRKVFAPPNGNRTYPYSAKITCGKCGKCFQRKINGCGTNAKYAHAVWICATYNRRGKKYCDAKQIPEDILNSLVCDILDLDEFDEFEFAQNIDRIIVLSDTTIQFNMTDGSEVIKEWQYKPRSELWTDEMRAATGEQTRRRNQNAT